MATASVPTLLSQAKRAYRSGDYRTLHASLDDLARSQAVEVLHRFHDALENEAQSSEPAPAAHVTARVQDSILIRLIVMGGDVGAVTAASITGSRPETPPHASRRRYARTVDLLSEKHPYLLPRLLEHEQLDPEFYAMLLQALVVRGAYTTPVMQEFWSRYRGPLNWLPLHLTEWEQDLPLPTTELDVTVWGGAWPVPASTPPASRRGTSRRVVFRPFSHPPREEAMGRPFQGLMKRSITLFRVGAPEEVLRDPRILLQLPAAPFQGIDEERSGVRKVSPAQVIARLFQAAASGGVNGEGAGTAYGRLRTWEATKGAVGATAAYFEMAVQAVGEATWFELEVHSPWFFQEASDYCLIGLLGNGEVAVMAASDTD